MEGGEKLASIADKLQALMEQHDVTAYAIAKNTNYTAPAVYSWVSGKVTPKTNALKELSEFFNVPITYFTDD